MLTAFVDAQDRRAPVVVKIGGSLLGGDRLAGVAATLARARRPLVIVPGGGGFADEVRHAQARHGVSDRAAHLMAMLAMHQTGLLLEDLQARFIAVETLAAISKALAANRIPVWLPLRLSEADDAIAADWSVTSDALAARLAERLRLGSVFLVKSRRVPAGPSAAELANAGIVDASFGEIVERARLSFRVFGPGEERELAEACLAQRACACEGRRPAGRGERARRSPRRPHPGAYVTPRG